MKDRTQDSRLYFAMLGLPSVFSDGVDLTDRIVRKKALGLLSYLVLQPSRSHLRKDLSALFWPELSETRADQSLRQTLYSLRKLFGLPRNSGEFPLQVDRTSVRINPRRPFLSDLSFLEIPPPGCLSLHSPEECPRCDRHLAAGIATIRGPFMEGFDLPECDDFRDWITATREMCQMKVLRAVDNLSRIRDREGRFADGMALVLRYLAMDPLDESQHRRLMEFHVKNGDLRAAEIQYEACRNLLRQELGVDPERKTREVYEKIRSETPQIREAALVPNPSFPQDPLPERRPVTVMFFECLGVLDPDEDPDLRSSELESRLSRAMERVRSLGGNPVRSHGTAFLAYFGLGEHREGAARRAARSALELARSWQSTRSIGFRGAIHSGMAIVTPTVQAPADPAGSVSRPAISLCMQADPGTLLLSEGTAALLRRQFLFEPAGIFRIVGDPLPAFRLIDGAEPGASPERELLPLIGREAEMSLFRESLDREGGGNLLISGEPGIGKSHLVRAFVRQARVEAARFSLATCLPHYSDTPYFPLIALLRKEAGLSEGLEEGLAYTRLLLFFQSVGVEDPERAAALLGPFFSLAPHPDFPAPTGVDPVRREEVEDILCRSLGARMAVNPLLVVEDLHWADDSTNRLLQKFLSGEGGAGGNLIILTSRAGESPSWLSGVKNLRRIDLPPLSPGESRELVEALAPDGVLSGETVGRIVRNADGIPLFIEEMTRCLLEHDPEEIAQLPEGHPRIPSTLSEVLFDRLRRLTPEIRLLLQKASVVGRTVPMDLFRVLAGEPIPRLERLLEEASRLGLVRRNASPPEDSFEFRHALIQEAAYQSMVRQERRTLHRQVVLLLEEGFPKRAAALPGVVARHWMAAEDFLRGAIWSEKAARSCLSRAAYIEAEQHARGGLAVCDRISEKEEGLSLKVRLLVLLGNILVERMGYGSREARSIFQQAVGLCASDDTIPGDLFPAFFGLWHSSLGGNDLGESRELADTLGRISDRAGTVSDRAVSLYASGCVSFWSGNFSRSLDRLNACRDAYTRARLGGERWSGEISFEEILSMAMSYRPWVLWFLGRYVSARRELELVLDQARVAEGRQKQGLLLSFACIGFRYFRLPGRVLEVSEELARHVRLTRAEGWAPVAQAFQGWALAMKGDARGIPLILRSLPLCRKAHRMVESSYLSLLSEAYLSLGEGDRAIGVADSALRISRRVGTSFYDAELWRIKGEAALLREEREEARRCYSLSLGISREQGARALKLRAATSLGRLLLAQGRKDEALLLLSSLGDLLFGSEADQSLPDLREAAAMRGRLLGRNVILHPLNALSASRERNLGGEGLHRWEPLAQEP